MVLMPRGEGTRAKRETPGSASRTYLGNGIPEHSPDYAALACIDAKAVD